MDKEIIKLVIKGLDEEFLKKKEKYETAKRAIQELCEHEETTFIMVGEQCNACGKIVKYGV